MEVVWQWSGKHGKGLEVVSARQWSGTGLEVAVGGVVGAMWSGSGRPGTPAPARCKLYLKVPCAAPAQPQVGVNCDFGPKNTPIWGCIGLLLLDRNLHTRSQVLRRWTSEVGVELEDGGVVREEQDADSPAGGLLRQ